MGEWANLFKLTLYTAVVVFVAFFLLRQWHMTHGKPDATNFVQIGGKWIYSRDIGSKLSWWERVNLRKSTPTGVTSAAYFPMLYFH